MGQGLNQPGMTTGTQIIDRGLVGEGIGTGTTCSEHVILDKDKHHLKDKHLKDKTHLHGKEAKETAKHAVGKTYDPDFLPGATHK